MLEFVCECEGVIASLIVRHALASVIILKVGEVFSTSMPSNRLLLAFLVRVDKNLHALIEQTFRLKEVEHIEFHLVAFPSVLNTEIEPLGVTLRVDIILQDKIVLFL